MNPGEVWAYRSRQIDPLVEVEVLRRGARRPARVLVRFADDEFEGLEQWVPPTRLKVLWSDRTQFAEREKRWHAVRWPGLPQHDPREAAAETVFLELIPSELARFQCGKGGIVTIEDVDALAETLNVDPPALTEAPGSFTEDGGLIAPWQTSELIATEAARNNRGTILAFVNAAEREAERASVHGRHVDGRTSLFVEPGACAQDDAKYGKPVRAVLRSWCGMEAIERVDDLDGVRRELHRLRLIASEAVERLRGHDPTAARPLSDQLGARSATECAAYEEKAFAEW